MNQNINQPKTSKVNFIFRNLALIIASIILIIVILVAISDQIEARADAFWDGVKMLFYIGSGITFTVLITTHLSKIKAPLGIGRILLTILMSAIFFYFCIQSTSLFGANYNHFLISTKQNKIKQNIEKIVTLEHFSSTNQELFNANDFLIKTEKEKQSQYYYINNSNELIEMKSLQNKEINTSGQSPMLSPLEEKIAVPYGDQLYIYDKKQNNSWVISVDITNYSGLYFRQFFFNMDEEIVFSLTDYKLGNFSIEGRVDFKNNSLKLSTSEEPREMIYPENQRNGACENIDEIEKMYITSYQSLANNNCLYAASSYNETERKDIYELKIYNASTKDTKIILKDNYTNIDLINILYIGD